jgi:large subunit ribosomal protein L18
MAKSKTARRERIKRSIRKNVFGTAERPRLTVFRSNAQIYAQLIDDNAGATLVSCGSLKNEASQKVSKVEQAKMVGSEIAEKALAAGINEVVFDRNGYLYHGRVKTLADSAREAGLKL